MGLAGTENQERSPVMAANRTLGVDTLPSHMQEADNLWVGRAVALGGFVGFSRWENQPPRHANP